jgi:hypothetical protein
VPAGLTVTALARALPWFLDRVGAAGRGLLATQKTYSLICAGYEAAAGFGGEHRLHQSWRAAATANSATAWSLPVSRTFCIAAWTISANAERRFKHQLRWQLRRCFGHGDLRNRTTFRGIMSGSRLGLFISRLGSTNSRL